MNERARPVVIFQTGPEDGPGSFADFLAERDIPVAIVRVDLGQAMPRDPRAFSGIGVMGGSMSVNDPLPWIAPLVSFIGDAMAERVPVIGHCLGGQLMAKALGAMITANPVHEIGWGEIHIADTSQAWQWFGPLTSFEGFHWHGETFSLPKGTRSLAASAWCANQVFVHDDIHLGMQCHVEMTVDGIRRWCEEGAGEIAAHARSPGVQQAGAIGIRIVERVAALRTVAFRLYARWLSGVTRGRETR